MFYSSGWTGSYGPNFSLMILNYLFLYADVYCMSNITIRFLLECQCDSGHGPATSSDKEKMFSLTFRSIVVPRPGMIICNIHGCVRGEDVR